MLNPYVSCSVYAVEMLIYYIFFSRIAQRRFSHWKCLLVGLGIFEISSTFNLLFRNNLFVNTASTIFMLFFFASICFQIGLSVALAYGFFFDGLNFAIESIVVIGLSSLWHTDPSIYNSELSILLISATITKLLLFLFCFILSAFLHKSNINTKIPLPFLFYPVFTTVCLLLISGIALREECSHIIRVYLCYISVILFFSVIIFFTTYLHQLEKETYFTQMKLENERLETERDYYRILEEQNQKLMVYSHDTKKHLQALMALSDDPDIQCYIGKLLHELRIFSRNCHSGNKLLDVMLDKYTIVCQQQHINFSFEVRNCNLSALDDMDLVAILGNIMDNAIRATQVSKRKSITLQTMLRNGFQVLVLTNSCDTTPVSSGRILSTSKKDSSLHGFGLKSVEKSL